MQRKSKFSILLIFLLVVSFYPSFRVNAMITHDIGSDSINCSGGEYKITGSTSEHNITIEGNNPVVTITNVKIDMTNEKDDDKSVEEAAICVKEGCNATLIVEGTNWLRGGNQTGVGKNWGYAGINIEPGASLTIKGQTGAKLTVYGGGDYSGAQRGGAAIGSNSDDDMGDLTIEGNLTIEAHGAIQAAGIGSGYDAVAGNITIKGGDITATGGGTEGEGGAGIGGSDGGEVGSLVIEEMSKNSLHITAQGGKWGAGIGSSAEGVTSHNIPSIYIKLNGGTINAKGGEEGAGIGGGNTSANKIEIYGEGTINVTGVEESCAIGAGECEDGGVIIIEGDYGAASYDEIEDGMNRALQITATVEGISGAAIIGAADSGGGDISIKNAAITLVDHTSGGEKLSAAIGNAVNHSMLQRDMGSITIENCKIVDTENASKRLAATIGAGVDSEIDNITIKMTYLDGGTIGGSNNSNDVFKETSVDSITIEKSKIIAKNESEDNRAAIGSGNFAAVDKITIKDSEVTAYSISGAGIGSGGYSTHNIGDALKWTGCECGDITITGSTVTATGGEGGAGIGGGWGTSVGDIVIRNSKVEATAANSKEDGAAGIGGGHAESCGEITIENSEIKATAGKYSAGIGSSGFNSITTTVWNTTCHSIHIRDNSTVTAIGGEGGAGIGTGHGAQFDSYSQVVIVDSTVTATGGYHGAGIGAGANGTLGSGGQMGASILLEGNSRIIATGGEGAAGIGGGYDGGADRIYIRLSETTYLEEEQDWKYYVKAYGGKGAAGIGAGGIYETNQEVFTPEGHNLKGLDVTGGYVYAKGGDEIEDNGAGSGIGGGAHGGNLKYFFVYGGYIEAHAGSITYGGSDKGKHYANDIGCGGLDLFPLEKDGDAYIYNGTVLGDYSDELNLIIEGGSVRCNSKKAETKDEIIVYQTNVQIGEKYYKLQNAQTESYEYGTKDIISDENGKVYLYLQESEKNQSILDCTVNNENRHYYGTTTTDGNSWLKMNGILQLNEPVSEPTIGEAFTITVSGDALPDGTTMNFDVTGDHITVEDEGTNNTMPGAQVQLIASDWTEYTVNVSTDDSYSNEMYWDAKGSYSNRVARKKGTIEITEDISKVYDGEAVEDPSVTVESDVSQSQVTYKYYDASENLLTEKPVNAGTYLVEASIPATDYYTAASTAEKVKFEIEKSPVTIELTASEDNANATVSAKLSGYVGTEAELEGNGLGKVTFTIDEETYEAPVTINADGEYCASKVFQWVSSENYQVKANLTDAANYQGIAVEQTFSKNKVTRTIEIEPVIHLKYGAGVVQDKLKYKIKVVNEKGEDIGVDAEGIDYQIVYTAGQGKYDESIVIDRDKQDKLDCDGKIYVNNAGLSVVKISLAETERSNEAVAYTTIIVDRAELTVTPYAYNKDDSQKIHLTEVTYGSVDELTYDVDYNGLVNGDTPSDFTKGYGTFEVTPLNETTDAGTYSLTVNKLPGEKSDIFLSRNYKITLAESNIEVTPATLYIKANDVTSKYGVEPTDFSCTFGDEDGNYNLMPWDIPEDVIENVEMNLTLPYSSLPPGTYPGSIVVNTKKDVTNYKFTKGLLSQASTNYTGTLTIEKGDLLLEASISNKTYDGKAVELNVSLEPVMSEGISKYDLVAYGEPEVTYYLTDEKKEKLTEAPVNAGIYLAVITAPVEDDIKLYYNDVTTYVRFCIYMAHVEVETPQVKNLEMKEGLSLSDQTLPDGWTWKEPDKELSVGEVSATAIYTPEDTRNYCTEERTISFLVLEKRGGSENENLTKPGISTDPENPIRPGISTDLENPSNTESGAEETDFTNQNGTTTNKVSKDSEIAKDTNVINTGDDNNELLWGILIVGMLGVIVGVCIKRRKK